MEHKYIYGLYCLLIAGILAIFLFLYLDKPNINKVPDIVLYQTILNIDGIGEKYARAVVDYRNKNNPIVIDQLVEINGIGPKRLKDIKEKFRD